MSKDFDLMATDFLRVHEIVKSFAIGLVLIGGTFSAQASHDVQPASFASDSLLI